MPAVLDADLERSFVAEFISRLGSMIEVDEPGKMFRARGKDRWVEPRLTEISELTESRGNPSDVVVWTIRCFVKIEAKGERDGALSELTDAVKATIDPRCGADTIPITDTNGVQVGTFQAITLNQTRSYNQSFSIRGDPSIPGLDLATLTVSGLLNVCST